MRDEPSERDAAALRELLPDVAEAERGALWAADPAEFSIAENLVYYARDVRAIGRGALFVLHDLEAMCGYRDDLDDQLSRLPDTELRAYLVTQLDLIDVELMGVTVHETPPWRPSLDTERWWWHRTPRRTDQRLFLSDRWEPTVVLPERIQRAYEAAQASGVDQPFTVWWQAQRASHERHT